MFPLVKSVLSITISVKTITHLGNQTPPDGTDLSHSCRPIHTVRGDVPFADGIDLLLTPGHTAGTQSVCIETTKGKAVIPGFCSDYQNFDPPDKAIEVYPLGYHFDLLQGYASALKIKKVGAILLPPHEPALEQLKSIS